VSKNKLTPGGPQVAIESVEYTMDVFSTDERDLSNAYQVHCLIENLETKLNMARVLLKLRNYQEGNRK
jgi:hypothetical protein